MKGHEVFGKLPEEKRKRIIHAAVEEFSAYGFHQASINRIVSVLGIAKGSIFQYFGSKEGLFSYIFEYAVKLVGAALKDVRSKTEEMSFFERLKAILLAGIDFVESHPKIYKIYLKMIFQENFPFREEFLKKIHLFSIDFLNPLVERAIEKGEIRQDLDIDMVAFFLDSMLDRFLQAYTVAFWNARAGIYQASRAQLEIKVEQLINIIAKGLSPQRQEQM